VGLSHDFLEPPALPHLTDRHRYSGPWISRAINGWERCAAVRVLYEIAAAESSNVLAGGGGNELYSYDIIIIILISVVGGEGSGGILAGFSSSLFDCGGASRYHCACACVRVLCAEEFVDLAADNRYS
jgi:hypothetical protein